MSIVQRLHKIKSVLNHIWARGKVSPSSFSHLSVQPFAEDFGYNRGTPIDRFYIEQFLGANRSVIKGHVLEIGENTYTKKFADAAFKSSVLAPYEASEVDIVCDLGQPVQAHLKGISDCFICVQTLNFIYDFKGALKNIKDLMKPGGTVLFTVAGISQISKYDSDRWGGLLSFYSPRFRARVARGLYRGFN